MNLRVFKTIGMVKWSIIPLFSIGFAALASAQSESNRLNIDGFTEPLKTVKLASDDSGILSELLVEEGDYVKKGQVVAKLDQRMQEIQLKLAEHRASSKSNLNASRQLLEKREQILDEIRQLRAEGHASESEMIRAEMELSIARSKFLAAEEESISREIDLERAHIQHDRRLIRSPLTGQVAEVHRQQGEFVSPVTPEVITLIRTDKLFAVFNIPGKQISEFQIGQSHLIKFANGQTKECFVDSIGIQTDAQSSTIQVKLLMENRSAKVRAGEQCIISLDLPSTE